MNTKETSNRVYAVEKRARTFYGFEIFFFIACLAFFIYATISSIGAEGNYNPFFKHPAFVPACFIFISLFETISATYSYFHCRLTISPEGIEYHNFGVYLSATWNGASRIGTAFMFLRKREGLFVRPAPESKFWLGAPLGSTGKEMFIPLTLFVRDWRNSSLGDELKQYAPRLFPSTPISPDQPG